MPQEFVAGVELPRTVHLDIDAETVKKLVIDQEVSISIKGVVKSLNIPPDLPDENDLASFSVRITKQTVEGRNVFAELADETDEED